MKTGLLWMTLAMLLHLQVAGQEIEDVKGAKLDSLSILLKSEMSDTARLVAYNEFASLARGYYDSLTIVNYTAFAVKIARRLGFKKEELYLLQQASYYYFDNWYLDTTISINKKIVNEASIINDTSLQIESYNLIGDSFWWGRNYDSALVYYQDGHSLAKSVEDISWQATFRLSSADTYRRLMRNKEAIEHYQRAERTFRVLGDLKNAVKCITRIGQVYANQGNVHDALEYFRKAEDILNDWENLERKAEINLLMGEMYNQQKDFSMAVHYYQKAIQFMLADGDQYNAILIYLQLGSVYFHTGNYRLALMTYNEASQLSKENGDRRLITDALYTRADLEYLQGEYAKAYETYKKCLNGFEQQERKIWQIHALLSMGRSLQKLQQPRESIKLCYQTINLGFETNDTIAIAKGYLSLALAYAQVNQVDSVDTFFNKALQYCDEIKMKNVGVVISYISAGEEYVNRAEIPKALSLYEKAFDIATENRDTVYLGKLYNKIAELYQVQANYSTANSYHQKAFDLYEASKNTFGIASTNTGWANLNKEQGKYTEAIRYARKAVSSYQSIDNYCKTSEPLKVIGESYLYLEQPDTALTYLLNADRVADKCSDLVILTDVNHLIGKVYDDLGDEDRAFRYYEKAMLLAQKSHNREVLMKTARTLYPLYEERGQATRALEAFKVFHMNNDSINKRENSKALIRKELAAKHEKEMQEATLIQQQKAEKQRWLIYSIIAACLALVAISLAVYRNYRNKYKANLLLTHQNKEIARQKAELEALDESKSRFFANISHELRTPLTLISSPLRGLLNKKDDLPVETQRTLQLMERNTGKLKELVNDILDLSKLESNEIKLNEQEVNIHAAINRIFSSFESLASHLEIGYKVDLQLLPDEILLLDLDKLEKILNNLLSNALKHTASGGCVMLRARQKGQELVIEVEDKGTGISAKDLPYIFDRFYQSGNPDTPLQGGTGIGLALAKELTQSIGGTIAVESEAGQGSVFTLHLPYQSVDDTLVNDRQFYQEMSAIPKHLTFIPIKNSEKAATVLVVEDHPDMQEFVNSLIAPYHKTLLANNGKVALDILAKEPVDLIVSDVMMPEMDGYALLNTLKDSDDYRSIPVIMLTALGDEKHKMQALTTGVDDYLTKPFSPDELLVRLQNLLERNVSRKQWLEAEENLKVVKELDSASSQNEVDDIDCLVKGTDIAWLKQVEKAIAAELQNEGFKLSELAGQFFLSERQFQRKIKKLTGLTPNKYKQEVAMQSARLLLEQRKCNSVKEVAFSVGIYQTYRFTKCYQERFGKDPQEYFNTLVE